MANTGTPIAQAYAAFNRRDVDGALALMTETVSWPKASEGGRVVGKKRSVPTGRVSGRSLILMWNRSELSSVAGARRGSGFISS